MEKSLPENLTLENGLKSLDELCAPLRGLPGLTADLLGPFQSNGDDYFLPRFTVYRSKGTEPIRLGIFAAIHGDEPAGALALVQFLHELAHEPELADDYHIDAYPFCNPTGFEDGTRAA